MRRRPPRSTRTDNTPSLHYALPVWTAHHRRQGIGPLHAGNRPDHGAAGPGGEGDAVAVVGERGIEPLLLQAADKGHQRLGEADQAAPEELGLNVAPGREVALERPPEGALRAPGARGRARDAPAPRSEERSVGKGGDRTVRSPWSPYT